MNRIIVGTLIVVTSLFMLSSSNALEQGEPCPADFDCSQTVDANDVTTFLSQFGRSPFNDPCPDCYDSPCPCSGGITCEGTLSALGRWCDQGDGTVKDMTTGLVWLKKADWGGVKQWANCSSGDGAHTRVAQLWDGSPWEGTAALSDGSIEGDWQLPTKNELVDITVGTEYIRSSSMYFFTGVSGAYWSSSTHVFSIINAWLVNMFDGDVYFVSKNGLFEVWPVRRDNDR